MLYYITFRFSSDELKNKYRIIEADNWESAHEMAKALFAPDYSMVYSENQWIDYKGETQAQKFNLTEIKD